MSKTNSNNFEPFSVVCLLNDHDQFSNVIWLWKAVVGYAKGNFDNCPTAAMGFDISIDIFVPKIYPIYNLHSSPMY